MYPHDNDKTVVDRNVCGTLQRIRSQGHYGLAPGFAGPAAAHCEINDGGCWTAAQISLCRGGFFPALSSEARQAAIEDNLRAIDQAVELGAPLVVLVPGAHPGQPLETSRAQIEEGIREVLPHAAACDIKLGIEPLHPMLVDTRSAINTLEGANDICERFDSPYLGVVVDVHHLWWDTSPGT